MSSKRSGDDDDEETEDDDFANAKFLLWTATGLKCFCVLAHFVVTKNA